MIHSFYKLRPLRCLFRALEPREDVCLSVCFHVLTNTRVMKHTNTHTNTCKHACVHKSSHVNRMLFLLIDSCLSTELHINLHCRVAGFSPGDV